MAGSISSGGFSTSFVGTASAAVDNTNVVATSKARIVVINRHATNTIWMRTDGTDATAASGSVPVLPLSQSDPIDVDEGTTTKVSVLGSASNEPFAVVVSPSLYRRRG